MIQGMSKLWQITPPPQEMMLDQFPEVNPVVLRLLHNRGVTEPRVIEKFLAPEYKDLYSPFLFQQMERAMERVWQAIENHEHIVIYGDYDADAVTANAVLQQAFRYLNVPVRSYIPDRFTEGYGLNVDAFAKLKEQGAQLVISVDCGTNSVDVANYCKENNLDLIITDHHEITGAVPEVYALINPKNPQDLYPDDQITGVGVAYKLAKAILSDRPKVVRQKQIADDEYSEEWDKWLLDLVAIGTVADCHSLLGENRILVKFGLRVLPKTKWLGLRQLMENAGVDLQAGAPDTRTLGFSIAPRINAAGRLEHADIALDLLMSTDYGQAITLSNQLEEINRRRQDMTGRIVSQAKEQAELIADRKVLLVAHQEWPKGLAGLVAGRLADHYKKPVLVLEKGLEESTGSARTSGGFDVLGSLKASSQYLVKFGGHKQAAGLTVRTEQLENLYREILKFAETTIVEESGPPVLELEGELKEQDISLDTYEELEKMEPFGVGNPKPRFMVSQAQVLEYKLVGANKQHAQVRLTVGAKPLDCIGFSMAYLAEAFPAGSVVDIAGELIADSWNGTKKLKFKLIDMRTHEQNPGN
jgi:single-stranded-DNA-specific exonuclease